MKKNSCLLLIAIIVNVIIILISVVCIIRWKNCHIKSAVTTLNNMEVTLTRDTIFYSIDSDTVELFQGRKVNIEQVNTESIRCCVLIEDKYYHAGMNYSSIEESSIVRELYDDYYHKELTRYRSEELLEISKFVIVLMIIDVLFFTITHAPNVMRIKKPIA